jgi:hypothetical protein
MATYKVPQDVEADDKLLGPFSFRQFVYLFVAAGFGLLAWGLSQIFFLLAIIPLPAIVFLCLLALPLRKDQPMEIYMAAMISYYRKPRNRKWDPEGIETLIEITAPKTVEVRRTKDISQGEAEARLSYLASIVDTGGWAIRGVQSAGVNPALNNDISLEAQSAPDVLDLNNSVAQNFDQMMSQSTARVHEEAKERMMQATYTPSPTPAPVPVEPSEPTNLQFNPYPTFHQSIIQPLNDTAHEAQSDIDPVKKEPSGTSVEPQASPQAPQQIITEPPKVQETTKAPSDDGLTADIMNLANNPDFSIETIAHEAKRIHKKAEEESEEVVISLR